MSYRLEPDEELAAGIKRIAKEQVDKATEQLTEQDDGPNEAVHDARKRFKKIRAVLRLVRDEVGEEVYRQENTFYRDAGRRLADMRDGVVKIKTLDKLVERVEDQLEPGAFARLRDSLKDTYKSVREEILADNALAEVAETIETGRKRIDDWPIEHEDFAALYDGLKRVYKRGYKGIAKAYAEPTPENFHEWRKRVKYLWYHSRILKPLWADMFAEQADQLHDLSDYLGDYHDLTELRYTVLDRPDSFKDESEMRTLLSLIDWQSARLARAAQPLGERVYVEKPKRFTQRIAGYWKAWETELWLPEEGIEWEL